jgi:hypothetical protein
MYRDIETLAIIPNYTRLLTIQTFRLDLLSSKLSNSTNQRRCGGVVIAQD